MANTVTRAAVYNAILDEVITAGLTSAPLTANASRIQYNGGNTVKIAKLSVDGYSDYNRDTGYVAGNAVLAWEDHLIRMDRGKSFNVDAMDQDETQQTLSATNIIAEFARTHAVPEIDSYRYSMIFQAIVDDASVRYGYYTPVEATVLGTLQSNIADIQNVIGEQEPLVCFISGAAFKFLTQSTQLSRQLGVQNVAGANGVTTKIYDVDGVRLISVPSARMKTEYAFGSNGFAAKAWAQDINWILMSPNAGTAFVKHQKMKIVSADDNQTADAEKVMTRQYHDMWVYENKHNAIYVSLKVATITGFDTGVITTTGLTNITYTLGALYTAKDTGHKFYYFDGGSVAAKTAPACYDDFVLTGYVEITVATAVADVVTSGYYGALVEVDENGRAIRFATLVAAA